MLKYLLTIFISFPVVSEWKFQKENDPFEGEISSAYSWDIDNKGYILFNSRGEVLLNNGDNFICTNPNYSSYKFIDVLFKIDEEVFSQEFAIGDANDMLVYKEELIGSGLTISKSPFTRDFSKKVYSNRGIDIRKFVSVLKRSEFLLIRTSDNCGTQIDLEFDMSGFEDSLIKLGYLQ